MEKDVVIIVPAYNPEIDSMLDFLAKMKDTFNNVVIVNDGGGKELHDFFQGLKDEGYDVISHSVRLGKGRALKSAINHALEKYPDTIGVITTHCNGVYSVRNLKRVAEEMRKDPHSLIIGSRNFDEKEMSWINKIHAKLTRSIFSAFVGVNISDSQSGLRAFGRSVMMEMLQVNGEKYDYETNMIIHCKEEGIKIVETPITTIGTVSEAFRHYDPIVDSIGIYKIFFKFVITALSSFFIDISLFSLFVLVLPEIHIGIITRIVVATVIARIISSLYNFLVNSRVVFKKKESTSTIIKYYLLVVVQMFVSAFAVSNIFDMLGINATFLKLMVDTVIFLVNFYIQREWIFRKDIADKNKEI